MDDITFLAEHFQVIGGCIHCCLVGNHIIEDLFDTIKDLMKGVAKVEAL